MVRIAVILGSTRPGRNADAVGQWVMEQVSQRTDATFELLDLQEYQFPLLDEPVPPAAGIYQQPHTQRWAETIAGFDGYIFVTPEYNHSIPASLKNAIDFIYKEWNNKAAGFVSYGARSGLLAAEHLRQIMGELQIADVREQVSFSIYEDFENYTVFEPRPHHAQFLENMLNQLIPWSRALQTVRQPIAASANA